jgi:tetratricopeptide (TPR) repeat protein
MAASCAQCPASYDVFLSHRGPDTKKSFAIWLKHELESQGLQTFFDCRSLKAGDDAPGKIAEGMRTAEWGVIVLSPGFFASGHCMKELRTFLDRGRAILIGFNLSADECNAELIVKRQRGTVWEQHGGTLWENCSKVGHLWSQEEWTRVVEMVKSTTILELGAFNGYWDMCIKEAVKITLQKLGRQAAVDLRSVINTTPFPRNMEFVGRDLDLRRLRESLAESFGRVCISGMGGMGKTHLALEYVYRHGREYGKILWVDSDSQSLKSGYLGLARYLGIQSPTDIEIRGATSKVLKEGDAIAEIREQLENSRVPCLLVLDNVDREGELLADLLPRRGPCHVLVTTRLRTLTNFGRLELDLLKKEDSLHLLSGGSTFSEQESQNLEQLAERFGHLTLALAVASRLFAKGLYRPSDLLQDLERKGARIFEHEPQDAIFKKHPGLVALFETSFAMLNRDTRTTNAEKEQAHLLIWVGGWFAPEPIHAELLAQAAYCLTSEPEWDKQKKLREALGLLCLYGLATRTVEGKVSFHPLVQSFGKWKGGMKAGVAMIQALLKIGIVDRDMEHSETAANLVLPLDGQAAPAVPLDQFYLPDIVEKIGLDLSYHHLGRCFQPALAHALVKRCRHALQLAKVSEHGKTWIRLWVCEIRVNVLLGNHEQASFLVEHALETEKVELEAVGPYLSNAVDLSLKIHTSQLSGEPLFEYLREMRAPRPRVEFGSTYGVLRKYKVQDKLHRQALQIREQELGPTHPDMAHSLHNLASALTLQGKFEGAQTLYLRALIITEELLGPRHPYRAAILADFADILSCQCEYREATPLYKQALEILEESLGQAHPETIKCRENLCQNEKEGRIRGACYSKRQSVALRFVRFGSSQGSSSQTRVSRGTGGLMIDKIILLVL